MIRKTRTLGVIATLGAGALVLSGCATNDGGGAAESKVLNYESYWTEGEPTAEILKEAAADFEESTGVTVNIQWKGRDLPATLAPLLSSSNPDVDIVDMACPSVQANLDATGNAADLSSVLEATIPGEEMTVGESMSEAVVATGQEDGRTFCLPYEVLSDSDFWFNAARFPDLVESPPTTWDEFDAILAEQGKGALALDGTIGGYAAYYFINFAVSAGGKGAYLEAAGDETGQSFIDDPVYLEAAKKVQELVDSGAFADGYTESKFPAIQQKWANDESDFLLVGSWIPSEVAPYAAEGFEYSSFPFPALAEGDARAMTLDSIGFGVLEKAPNVENAKKFIEFFAQKKYQDEIGQIAVPVRSDASVADNLASVQKALNDSDVVKIAYEDGAAAAYPTWAQDVGDPFTQKLVLGELSAEEFITQIAEASKNFWANQ
ncbi:ABC transporter substrate-binding protein [Herbiconiux sp. A18JL235]|uniref:ABC transporter substrate-binding protein n=1 Tax=Herbiconiux sp. A18JL235 TaxID=3152363 RepID=A0AB39BHT9_9MICO